MRQAATSALEIVGMAAITVGVGIYSIALACIVGGLFALVIGFALGGNR
jgi:hypothetical protein